MQIFKNIDDSSEGLEGLPWGIRTGVRVLTVFSGFLAMLFGLISCITLSARCLFAGVIMLLSGICMLTIEATFCCQFFTFASSARSLANYVERRPAWIRSVLYAISAVVPLLFCQNALVVLSFISTLACSAAYFMIAVGKRTTENSGSNGNLASVWNQERGDYTYNSAVNKPSSPSQPPPPMFG
ncbi:hypothetical protein GJ496_007953 [Pomphorhynchus laevis]|nr:hypothetical protein GJ496_007953 [Pomphorhynchus laevis]